jgi:hypothetical protein
MQAGVPFLRPMVTALVVVALAACSARAPAPTRPAPTGPMPTGPAPARPTPSEAPETKTAVLVGAGDIATCDGSADSRTAALVNRTPGTVFTLGDNAYRNGTRREFARCYGPTWGRAKARTRPVIGNHEYLTAGAAGYFDYFGPAAGPRGRGYYSYDIGAWHVVVLNTNCGVVAGGCGTGSPQQRWLRADLAAAHARCTVAMGHHPLFTSGATHPPATETRPLVRTLVAAGAELLLTGHNHVYERFAPQDADGRADPARGIRAFVVGTGGGPLYPFGRPAPNSEVRDNRTYGVLRLTLVPDGYRWAFLPAAGGRFTDAGSGGCH